MLHNKSDKNDLWGLEDKDEEDSDNG
jgi:hypothetical protein